jgi:hypothetical protein
MEQVVETSGYFRIDIEYFNAFHDGHDGSDERGEFSNSVIKLRLNLLASYSGPRDTSDPDLTFGNVRRALGVGGCEAAQSL